MVQQESYNVTPRLFFISLIPILFWSSNYVVLRYTSPQIPLSVFNGLRLLTLLPLLFFFKRPELPFFKMLLLAFVWIGFNHYCIGRAVESGIDTGYLALGYVISSVFVIIFSYLIHKEVLTKVQCVGVMLAFSGMGFVAYEKGFDINHLTGVGYLLASNFFIASGVMLLKRFNVSASLPMISWVSVLAAIPLFAMSIFDWGVEGVISQVIQLDKNAAYCILYTAIFSSFLGGLIWMDIVKKMGPNLSSFVMCLVPIFGMIFGYVFFDEVFTPFKMIASFLVLSGVFLCLNKTGAFLKPKVVYDKCA